MTISVILMLLGLLEFFGLVFRQSGISSAVITLRLSFPPNLIVIPWSNERCLFVIQLRL
jgi:hypothetical protein